MIAPAQPPTFRTVLLFLLGLGAVTLLTVGFAAPRIAASSLPFVAHPAMNANGRPSQQGTADYASAGLDRPGLLFITFDANGATHTNVAEVERTSFAPLQAGIVKAVAPDTRSLSSAETAGVDATSPVGTDLLPDFEAALPESTNEEVDAEWGVAPVEQEMATSYRVPALQESAMEVALFGLANADRQRNGLPTLQFAPQLLDIARQRAEAQGGQATLNHYLSDGNLAFVALFRAAGITFLVAGENLARNAGSDGLWAARMESALMGSPTHRANILDPRYQYLAVGSTQDSRGNTVFAQIFLQSAA